jgi:hypothetical protein
MAFSQLANVVLTAPAASGLMAVPLQEVVSPQPSEPQFPHP